MRLASNRLIKTWFYCLGFLGFNTLNKTKDKTSNSDSLLTVKPNGFQVLLYRPSFAYVLAILDKVDFHVAAVVKAWKKLNKKIKR